MNVSYSDLDFIVVGPGHTGSTWLGTQLRKTKDVYVTHECNWLTWSSRHSGKQLADYFPLIRDKPILGEHGNTYFAFPGMGEILHSECPTAKLIIVYRDPVARAISHYFHDRRYGTISRRLSVSYVLFPDFLCNRYINESLYGKHLTSLLKHFRPEQIYVFASPQDSEDPVEQFTDLQRYLGAKHADLPLEGFNEKINHRKIPFIPSLHWQAAFGKAGIVKLISRLIDPVNCALGSMLGYSEISRGDRELFANLIKESEQGDFFTLCEKNDIAGWKFIKKPST